MSDGTKAAQAPKPEDLVKANAGGVKVGLRSKKPTGFWKDSETVKVLQAFNEKKMTEEAAMKALNLGPDYVALRYYAKRLKDNGTTVRAKPEVPAAQAQ